MIDEIIFIIFLIYYYYDHILKNGTRSDDR